MLVLAVLEEIVDTVLLHQARDEREVGLAVLHAVFELGIVVGQGVAKVVEAALVEHVLDDLGRALVGEDPAMGGPGGLP